MKHLLNDMTEKEKNAIREQHTDRIKIDTSRFKSLMESKLGDVKTLVEQPTSNNGMSSIIPLFGADRADKTINFYLDQGNTKFMGQGKVNQLATRLNKDDIRITVDFNNENAPAIEDKWFQGTVGLIFKCFNQDNGFIIERGAENFGQGKDLKNIYNKNFSDFLKKQFCAKSSSGVSVPKADFASSQKPLGSEV